MNVFQQYWPRGSGAKIHHLLLITRYFETREEYINFIRPYIYPDSKIPPNYLSIHKIAGIDELLWFFRVNNFKEKCIGYDDEGNELNESGDIIPDFDLDKASVDINFPGTFVGQLIVVGESTNCPYVIRFSEFVEHKN